jgi:hypothetical protein
VEEAIPSIVICFRNVAACISKNLQSRWSRSVGVPTSIQPETLAFLTIVLEIEKTYTFDENWFNKGLPLLFSSRLYVV